MQIIVSYDMTLPIWIAIFLLSLALLVKGSDLLSDAAEKIGLYFGIPSFIVGVTIVAFGTSLPELFTSIMAVLAGESQLVVSNAVGSNLTNILFILGFGAILAKDVKVSFEIIHVDLPIFIGATAMVVLSAMDGQITRIEGVLLAIGLVIYLLYTVNIEREKHTDIKQEIKDEHSGSKFTYVTFLLGGLASTMLALGAGLAVQSIIQISARTPLDPEVVSVTVFALGTSMPELFVAINASRKGLSEILVGSILGSSIFNLFGVIGISAILGNISVGPEMLMIILPFTGVTALLYFFITQEKEITKWEGMLLLLFYCFFLVQTLILV